MSGEEIFDGSQPATSQVWKQRCSTTRGQLVSFLGFLLYLYRCVSRDEVVDLWYLIPVLSLWTLFESVGV